MKKPYRNAPHATAAQRLATAARYLHKADALYCRISGGYCIRRARYEIAAARRLMAR